MNKVSIIGNGWVGRSMNELFPNAFIYHPNRENEAQVQEARHEANNSEVSFICVPSPLQDDGTLNTAIVEDCIKWLETPLIVIRSTVNPGDCDRWADTYHKVIVFQPEYLGETPNHPLLNEVQTPFLVIGAKRKEASRWLVDLYTKVYNANVKIRQVSLKEAELIKLTENRAIAFKVMQCQELYDVCEKAGIDYYTVRDAVYGDDPRFNLWFTFIYPEKRGFNSSKCLVKDVPAWCAFAESVGINPEITRMLVERSNKYER